MPDVYASIESVTDNADARMRAFARLLVRTGVNLSEGQELLVDAQHEHAPFVRALARRPTRRARATSTSRTPTVGAARARRPRRPTRRSGGRRRGWSRAWSAPSRTARRSSASRAARTPRSSTASIRRAAGARARFRDFDRVWLAAVMGPKIAWTLSPTRRGAGRARCSASPTSTGCGTRSRMRCAWTSPTPPPRGSARLDELDARARALTERALHRAALPRPGHRPRGRR